jgi:hypothetical protein
MNRRQFLRRTAANSTLLALPFISARHGLHATNVKEASRFVICPSNESRVWSCLLLFVLVAAAAHLQAADWWRFEQRSSISAEAPASWIYDPLSGTSVTNSASWRVNQGVPQDLKLPAGKARSFTLEFFAKPDGEGDRSQTIACRMRASQAASELRLGLNRFQNDRQTYWMIELRGPGTQPLNIGFGHYVTIARLHSGTLGWRHLAVVYDAERLTLTSYLDHWLGGTRQLEAPLIWDEAPLRLGAGSEPNSHFDGLIDEVRLTPRALTPAEFLRAVPEPMTGVSYSSVETVLPRGSGYLDLKENFGAVGDGAHDDTAAFQKAFSDLADKVPGAFYTLYVPPGTYRVTQPIRCSRFIIVQGSGRDRTTLRLADHAPGFTNAGSPQPVWRASSTDGPPNSNPQVNGSSIGIWISDLTIDTGCGNAGAKALEYHSNNHGSLERVCLRSGDGLGVTGLDLTHHDCGPALIKDVEILGFDTGIAVAHAEYSLTFENIRLRDQRKVGLHNVANMLAIRRLDSRQERAPALISEGGDSMITLLEANLIAKASTEPAIRVEGAFYGREVKVGGYPETLRQRVFLWHGWQAQPQFDWKEGAVLRGNIAEWWGGKTTTLPGDEGLAELGSLKLPIEETPEVPLGDLHRDWHSVHEFASQRGADGDWTPAIQAAIDSGARTVYLPWGTYPVSGTVHLRGRVERLRGMKATLVRPDGYQGQGPLLDFDATDAAHVALIEHLGIRGELRHGSPGTLVIKHESPAKYVNTRGCGKLFLEDVIAGDLLSNAWEFAHPQKVWARQWNPEAHGTGPVILSRGATIWALGFKTEYESSKLHASEGARTEILGGFIYPVVPGIPEDRPVFKNIDSEMSLIYGQSVYQAGHPLQVEDIQAGKRRTLTYEHGIWAWSRFRVDLFRSGNRK